MKTERSHALFARSLERFPGGVNSPVRAFRQMDGEPRFIAEGSGSRLMDADGNSYVDYVLSWGALPVGHAHPVVVEAIVDAVQKGTGFGAPTEVEIELADLICGAMPHIERLRFVSSGTEAVMSALRLARAYAGRDLVVKFEGCYHGHADQLLVAAGSEVATLSLPDSPGVPSRVAETTIVAPFNDLKAVAELFERLPREIAAVIVEPVAGNMGVVLPEDGFLEGLKDLTASHGALLIFDEVMTGFRIHLGGAAARFGVTPDLTTLGKVIGGGLPVGAYGGRRDIMDLIAPSGPVYQAGTLAGNPIAMTAGVATLNLLLGGDVWRNVDQLTEELVGGLVARARNGGEDLAAPRAGSMFSIFFSAENPRNFAEVKQTRVDKYKSSFWRMLDAGVCMPPSAFEACFTSSAHTSEDVAATLNAFEQACAGFARVGSAEDQRAGLVSGGG